MANNMSIRDGQVYDDYSNADISLYFASYDDIEDLCNVVNWAFGGKPSSSSSAETYVGWVSSQQYVRGPRITPDELRSLIGDKEHNAILVAKLKIPSGLKIVGCCQIDLYDKNLQVGDEEKNDVAITYGLNAVDPDYQSRGIGTLMFNGAMRLAKEYFNAQRVYSHIISSKRKHIEWRLRQGFIDTGRLLPFPSKRRSHVIGDYDELKFSVLTKRI